MDERPSSLSAGAKGYGFRHFRHLLRLFPVFSSSPMPPSMQSGSHGRLPKASWKAEMMHVASREEKSLRFEDGVG